MDNISVCITAIVIVIAFSFLVVSLFCIIYRGWCIPISKTTTDSESTANNPVYSESSKDTTNSTKSDNSDTCSV
jgi:hypothetical protein